MAGVPDITEIIAGERGMRQTIREYGTRHGRSGDDRDMLGWLAWIY